MFCCYLLCVPLLLAAQLGYERRYRMLFCIVAFVTSQLVMRGFAGVCVGTLSLLGQPARFLSDHLPWLMFVTLALGPAFFVAMFYAGWKFYRVSVDFYDAKFPTTSRGRPVPTQTGVAL